MKEVRFSPSEQRMLAILKRERKPIATTDLVPKFYKGREDGPPEHAVSTIVSVSRALEKKTLENEAFRVRRSERAGPYPIKVWIEKKK